jgi:uncharacterized FlaG/YvyC family protein
MSTIIDHSSFAPSRKQIDPQDKARASSDQLQELKSSSPHEVLASEITEKELSQAIRRVESIPAISDTSLSFSIEEQLNRMVVAVRAVGSDELVRQFPPEEFLTVAKFLASQSADQLSDDYLKGLLFDDYS